ncbi:MAG: hypothetical protein NVS3B20_11390 [Polyangiales bacterium]
MLRAFAVTIPLATAMTVLGCPHDSRSEGKGEVPASSTVASSPAVSASGSDHAPYPKVVVMKEAEGTEALLNATPDASHDASLNASLDPSGDALDDGDASSTDADADTRRGRSDAPDDAPLLGTKTFQEENPMKGVRRVTSNAAKVHKAPRDGAAIASLQKGTEVSLVAEYLDWYRVRYFDPNTQQRRQGWIYLINFLGPRTKSCPTGWTHHEQDGGWCERECSKSTDCKAMKGYKCSGSVCFYAGDQY